MTASMSSSARAAFISSVSFSCVAGATIPAPATIPVRPEPMFEPMFDRPEPIPERPEPIPDPILRMPEDIPESPDPIPDPMRLRDFDDMVY
jgi:hypothetical protein